METYLIYSVNDISQFIVLKEKNLIKPIQNMLKSELNLVTEQ